MLALLAGFAMGSPSYYVSIGGNTSGWTLDVSASGLPGETPFDLTKVRLKLRTTADGAKPRIKLDAPSGWKPQWDRQNSIPIRFDRGGASSGWFSIEVDVQDAFDTKLKRYGTGKRSFYLPTTSEERLAAFKRKYVGRKVWVFGSSAWTDGKYWTHTWDPTIPAEIVDVKVSPGPSSARCHDAGWDAVDGWGPSWFDTQDVLELKLKLPAELHPTDYTSAGPFLYESFRKPSTTDTSVQFGRIDVADEWQMPYLLSFESPEPLLKSLSPKIQAAFHRHDLAAGMPMALVPYLVGYPNFEASLGDYARRDAWWWWGPAPYTYSVGFDKARRVSGFGMAGKLP